MSAGKNWPLVIFTRSPTTTSVHFKICQLPSRSTVKRNRDLRILKLAFSAARGVCVGGVEGGIHHQTSAHFGICQLLSRNTRKQTGEIAWNNIPI